MKKPKPELPSDWKNLRVPVAYGIALFIGAIGGYGWLITTFATRAVVAEIRQTVIVAQTQAQTALDIQMEDIMARIARLEAKPNKNSEDVRQINFLRAELERVRRMRSIK